MPNATDYRPSQFGDAQIPFEQAVSLCGPAAAVAFVLANGKALTLREARDLGKAVGWTPEAGMAGPASEKALLDAIDRKLGTNIAARLEGSADWGAVRANVESGQPVIVSTPRHYFTVSAFDPATGKFFVGTSGTDLKGGSAWMDADEIAASGRGVNGVLYMGGRAQPVTQSPDRAEESAAPPAAPPAAPGGGQGVSPAPARPRPAVPHPLPATPAPGGPDWGAKTYRQDDAAYPAIKPITDAEVTGGVGVPRADTTAADEALARQQRRLAQEQAETAAGMSFLQQMTAPRPSGFRLPAVELPWPSPGGFSLPGGA